MRRVIVSGLVGISVAVAGMVAATVPANAVQAGTCVGHDYFMIDTETGGYGWWYNSSRCDYWP
ncbi:hypothetical protein [Jiangella alkaliphila]|uniref:Uncharacterized protein n=1 Tax=Jiangella alkaliphila TaxID=419479 RepID=A0A1H2IT87_9ACTN|nr:hypothetical protein [Jiangella alkaliphila]SDU47282.1 hypothetical protein SAMN04488563_1986 [Jiangella alkaliphila]